MLTQAQERRKTYSHETRISGLDMHFINQKWKTIRIEILSILRPFNYRLLTLYVFIDKKKSENVSESFELFSSEFKSNFKVYFKRFH